MKRQDILENQAKIVYLGLGSNLGNKRNNIDLAKNFLLKNKIKILLSSSYYETRSWPNKNFPNYLNIVLKIKTNLELIILFKLIKKIEKKLGRKKSIKNYPRTCDIDIIDFDGVKMNQYAYGQKITVPHPRISQRNFVLIPLFEINKKWFHPKSKKNITNLLLNLKEDDLSSIKYF